MSPKVPEAYLKARRSEILEAASRCFMEKGFHNTTMQDIYHAANLSPGAVYNYFSSKEDIIVAANKQYSDWSIAEMESVKSDDPLDSLMNYIRLNLKYAASPEIAKSVSINLDFYSEASRQEEISKSMRKTQDTTHEVLVTEITKLQQAGTINADLDPLSIARAIMGMVFGIMIHKILEPEVDLEAYGEVCEAIFNGTFSSPPEKSRRV